MRSSKLPEICVPCPHGDDDKRIDRWFRGLAYAPHAADARLSALITAADDVIANVEVLFGLRGPSSRKGPGGHEPSS